MRNSRKFLLFGLLLLPYLGIAQKISYSEVDRNDLKTLNFDILGKINNNILIYKSVRDQNHVSVYDPAMQLISNTPMDFLPNKFLGIDFLNYKDFIYVFYQYQKRNVVYFMAAKIGGDGKLIEEPIKLDTTVINYNSRSKLYSIVTSENKDHLLIFKINSKNSRNFKVSSLLFSKDLQLKNYSEFGVPMFQGEILSEFNLDNNGKLVFARSFRNNPNASINELTIFSKGPMADTLKSHTLALNEYYLEEVKIKLDNINQRFLLTSFFSKSKRGNIEGMYCLIFNNSSDSVFRTTVTPFSDEIRNEAKTDGNLRSVFNDFYLENILFKIDGSFALVSEALYTSTRGIYNNRWDYFNNPYSGFSDYYFFNSPLYNSYYYPWSRWGGYNTSTRYFADNIAIMTFDSTANMEWVSIIHKSQYDDYTDNFIGYGTFNGGGVIHFLFNQMVKRTTILTDQTLSPDGQVKLTPTLHNLNKDYQFMARYAKQVSASELIILCQYRNFICFAKIEF